MIPSKVNYGSPKCILNTALCQSPSGVSKTAKAIDYIKHICLLKRFTDGKSENGKHHMNIMFTNNNLIETKMWCHRVSKNEVLKSLNISTLSSKKESTYNRIDQIKTKLVDAKKADDLPDIIIMCTHGSRTDDIIELINTITNGNLDFTKIGIHQITATIMFDEADKNIEIIVDFIKNITRNFVVDDTVNNTFIRDIHFITATPGNIFWKKLKSANIDKLKNINKILQEQNIHDNLINISYDDLLKEYRKFSDHNIKIDVDNLTENPVHYASLVLPKILHQRNKGLRIFAPGECYKKSHLDMKDLFTANDFTTLILNSDYKGFFDKNNNFVSLLEFNTKHNIQGEIYESLRKWNELYPDENLAITGYYNVERGITFNTTGFNFTDMIISKNHTSNKASFVQICGRASGDVKYVQKFNIWAPKSIIEEIDKCIEIMNEALRKNPEEYKESHFRKATSKERKKDAMCIPYSISITKEELDTILSKKKGKIYDEEFIKTFIGSKNKEIYDELKKLKKKQISMCETEKSIKKHITDYENAIANSNTYCTDITKLEENKDLYQIFIDRRSGLEKLIISFYYGSLIENIVDIE
jgi:hypothetical protein